jgi:putative hydrolase of the HAD superfamily
LGVETSWPHGEEPDNSNSESPLAVHEIKAVLFDLDRTLIDRDCAIVSYAMKLRSQLGSRVKGDGDRFVTRFIQLDARGYSNRRSVFAALTAEFLPEENASSMREIFAKEFPASVPPFPDSAAVLTTIGRQGLLTGVVTNGSGVSQRTKLVSTGMLPLLNTVIISEEVGCKKPDPKIFYAALSDLNCRPEEAMFVGDSEEADIRGAKAVGMITVLRRYPGEDFKTDASHEIGSLQEVLRLIREIAPAPEPA